MKKITLLFRGLRNQPYPTWCGDNSTLGREATGYERSPLLKYACQTKKSAGIVASCRSSGNYLADPLRINLLSKCEVTLDDSYALFTNIRLSNRDERRFVKSDFYPSQSPDLHWSVRISGLQRWITSLSRGDRVSVHPSDASPLTVIIASRRGKAYSHAGVCFNGMLFELVVEERKDVALYQSVSLADFLESSSMTDRCYIIPVLYGDFLSTRSAYGRQIVTNNAVIQIRRQFNADDFIRVVKRESSKDYRLCSHNCWDFVSAVLRAAGSQYSFSA